MRLAFTAVLVLPIRLLAQQAAAEAPRASMERPPQFSYGSSVGTSAWADRHASQSLGVVAQYAIRPWLMAAINPTLVRSTDTLNRSAQSGLSDLPLSLGASRGFDTRWSPSVGLTGGVALPTGDAAAGLGAGQMSSSLDLGAGLTPAEGLELRAGLWQGLSGVTGSSLSLEGSHDVGERVILNASFTSDLGHRDSTYARGRAIGAGLAYALAGPLTLTLGTSHTVSGEGPKWAMTASIGTAFAGVSLLGATSPIRHGRGGSASSLMKKVVGGSCRVTRTCR